MKYLTLTLLGASMAAVSAASYSTSFDGYTAGLLTGQDNWVAQNQWVADGAGNVTQAATNAPANNNAGAFVRGHNTTVLGSTAVGESMRITTTITLGAYSAPSGDIAAFEEGIIQLGMSHQQGSAAFAYGLAAGLFFTPGSGEVVLRSNQGLNEVGTTSASLGAASGLGGSSWTLETLFTKTAADTWSVLVSVDDGINPAISINYTANGETADLDSDTGGGGIIGGFQGLPSGGGSPGVATPPFGATTIADFALEVTPVPEPSVALLGGLSLLGLLRRRR